MIFFNIYIYVKTNADVYVLTVLNIQITKIGTCIITISRHIKIKLRYFIIE